MNSASCCKIQDGPDYPKVVHLSKIEGLLKTASSRFYELPNENNSNKVTLTWKNIDPFLEGYDLKKSGSHAYFDINMILEDLHSTDDNNLFGNIKLNINQSVQWNGSILLDLGIAQIKNEDSNITNSLISSTKIIDLSGKFESLDFIEFYLRLNTPTSITKSFNKNDIIQKKKSFNTS